MEITERKCWSHMQIRRKKTISYTVGNKQKKKEGWVLYVSYCRVFCRSLTLFVSNRILVLFSQFLFSVSSLYESVLENSADLTPLPSASSVAYRSVLFTREYETFYCIKTKQQQKYTISITHFSNFASTYVCNTRHTPKWWGLLLRPKGKPKWNWRFWQIVISYRKLEIDFQWGRASPASKAERGRIVWEERAYYFYLRADVHTTPIVTWPVDKLAMTHPIRVLRTTPSFFSYLKYSFFTLSQKCVDKYSSADNYMRYRRNVPPHASGKIP